jgi:aminopeptidase-like protein
MNDVGISLGLRMHQLMTELFSVCRSITGNGVRETLRVVKQRVPLEVHEVPSGTKVFDWTVPNEWNIRDAYIKNGEGERVVDFRRSNLHVVSYSRPVHRRMRLSELRPHLHSLPHRPEWIPYRTSYYREDWGFCLSDALLQSLPDDEYEVMIDSTLAPGHLTFGEYFVKGALDDEVLISCHVCHPSLANDNLSGLALSTELAAHVAAQPRRYSYRFLFIPGTIGSITWLALNEQRALRIQHGLVVTCVGDGGDFAYKKSRRGNAVIDRAAMHVLKHSGHRYSVQEFFPYGYDERQYCSPGFDLPVGCLMRSPHGSFPEYHTSADDLAFVRPQYLEESFNMYRSVVELLECNITYLTTNPKCEPQLGKRGLYKAIGGDNHDSSRQMAMLWVLNLADGKHSLLDIAERSGMDLELLHSVAVVLAGAGLLVEQPTDTATKPLGHVRWTDMDIRDLSSTR